MFSPEMNRWQMALANSAQFRGGLVYTEMFYPEDEKDCDSEKSDYPYKSITGKMCCLGVGLHANGVPVEVLSGRAMPYTLIDEYKSRLTIDMQMQKMFAKLNDMGISHRIIREMLIDFAMTGDPTEIEKRSGYRS